MADEDEQPRIPHYPDASGKLREKRFSDIHGETRGCLINPETIVDDLEPIGPFGNIGSLPLFRKRRKTASSLKPNKSHSVVHPSTSTSVSGACSSSHFQIARSCEVEPVEGSYEIKEFDAVKSYALELSRLGAILPCLPDFSYILIFDYDVHKRTLKKQKPIFLKKHLKCFDNGKAQSWNYIYECLTCTKDANILSASADLVESSFEEFCEICNLCVHSKVSKVLLMNILPDNKEQILFCPDEKLTNMTVNNIIEVPFVDGLCISIKDTFGVVVAEPATLRCLSCRFNTHCCMHTEFIINSCRTETEHQDVCQLLIDATLSLGEPNTWRRKPVSFQKIPINTPKNYSEIFKHQNNFYEQFSNDNNEILFAPPDCCPNCKENRDVVQLETIGPIPFFLESWILHVKVAHWLCPNCGRKVSFDGNSIAILNMGTYLLSHRVLRTYLRSFRFQGSSLHSFFKMFSGGLTEIGCDAKLLTYEKLKSAWDHFLNLLEIDYSSGFQCPLCLESPEVVVCDGTSLAFRRKHLGWEQYMTDSSAEPKINKTKTSSFSERIFVSSAKCRTLLQQFAESSENHLMASDAYISLQATIQELKDSSIKKAILTLLSHIKIESNSGFFCQKEYRDLITLLSKKSPVCATIPFSGKLFLVLQEMVSDIEIRKHPEKLQTLKTECPIIFKLFHNIKSDLLPSFVKPLFLALMVISKKSYPEYNIDEDNPHALQPEAVDSLGFFPSLPKKRSRGYYTADKKTTFGPDCNKRFTGHPVLLPGIFTLYCPHGICYGFEVMSSAESVNVPFRIFRTRFRKSPKIIIYDFACGLHAYCLNRDPQFFRETLFLVDRFHWSNHKACAVGYSLSSYDHLKDINSEINEQMNSTLKKIKSFVSYMTQDNFLKHCALYIWMHNQDKIKSIVI